MGDAAMTLPDNPLGLQSFDELVEWTVQPSAAAPSTSVSSAPVHATQVLANSSNPSPMQGFSSNSLGVSPDGSKSKANQLWHSGKRNPKRSQASPGE